MKEDFLQKLSDLKKTSLAALGENHTLDTLYQTKVRFLGKKGLITDILKELGKIPAEDRPSVGGAANALKDDLEDFYNCRVDEIRREMVAISVAGEKIDLTLPGFCQPRGRIHPISQTLSEMKEIFRRMGFDIHEGPEIETDYYNFEALNIPANHPARDMQDTFYVRSSASPLLLRTHTSPVQIRVMEKQKPPIQMIAPGTVYRRDSDVSHSPMFHQIEGLMVDSHISLGHLKGVIETFLGEIFEPHIPVKFRPSFFPFTEPSAEVDIGCVICQGKGCRVCKQTGWLEIMGCGMVDPAVFGFVKINPKKYTGFAFGLGIERVAMLKYGIDDIRLFYENDVRFLEQF